MVLTKNELISALGNEVRLLLHLMSKVEPAMLDYRPTPKQRSLLELLQYLTMLGPIHMRGVMASPFDLELWKQDWTDGDAAAKALDLAGVQEAIAKHPAYYSELLGGRAEEEFRDEHEMFGSKMSRGAWAVALVLNHYAAYRMQLFLYLKSCGREELNTLNLWVGMDGKM